MPKFMNMKNKYCAFKMDLQLFAEDSGDDAGDDAGDGDDQDDDQGDGPDKDGEDELKYTKADLEKAVARTIAKERARAERAAKRKEQKEKDSGADAGESEDAKARKEAEGKASRLEVKVACYEADVAKDAVDDVAALAHAYMEADDSLDLEDAIEKVVKKYPHFKNHVSGADDETDNTKGKAWGERQKGKGSRLTGVEAAFLKKNPGLKY